MSLSVKDLHIPLGELYDAVVMDHSSRPRNFGPLPDATVTMSGDNPSCGDALELSLKIDPVEDKLVGVGFTGHGCTICMASASMMTQKIKGKTRSEATSLLHDFQSMIASDGDEAPKSLGDLRVLNGAKRLPLRVKCATLAWHALRGALDAGGQGQPRTFSVDAADPGSEQGRDLR